MPQVDPVILQLKADVADYQRDLTRAQRLSEDKLGRIDRAGYATGVALRKGFNVAKAAAVSFAAALSVDLVVGAIKSGLDYASSLGEVAQQLGVTTTALQEYRYAGSQAGLANEEIDQALSQLTRRIGEAAAGTKEQAEAFQKLGISLKGANGEILDAGDAIPLIAEAMKGIESPAERAAILMDLFGRSGQKLEPLLAGGANAVNNLRDAAHKLGIVLSEDQIQNADDAADKLDQVKQVLQARLAGVVADNAKEIIELANALANLADKAIKAASAFLAFKRKADTRDAKIERADAYLDSRKDLTPAQRTRAKAGAREIIDRNEGFRPVANLGVFGSIKRAGPPTSARLGQGRLAGDFSRMVAGAGEGPGIAALLALEPAAAVKAISSITAELQQLDAEIAAARAELSGNLQEAAAAEKQQIDARLAADIEQIRADDDTTKAKQDEVIQRKTLIASLEKQAVDARLAEDAAEDARDLAKRQQEAREENVRLELDALSAESDLADTRTARLEIERRILDLRQEAERAALEEAIAAGEIADAAAARAAQARRQSAERGGLDRDFEGPLARYARDARDATERVEEAAARRIADLNDAIADTMTKALGVKDPFLRDLLKIFLHQNVFGPLAEALSRRGAGGGGLLGSIIGAVGSIFGVGGGIGGGIKNTGNGKASGGYVSAGNLYRVNEGSSPGRVEGFIPQGAGEIIPLGRMNAMQPGGGTSGELVVRLMLSDDIDARIDRRSTGVAVEVVRASARPIIDAAAAETMRRATRPRL